jgi:hypothetical protein
MIRRRFWIPMLFVGIVMGGWLMGDDKDPPPKLKGTLPTNWKKLGLNEDQVQDVYRVKAKFGAKIDQLMAEVAALKKEEKIELEKILTPAQKDRLKEILTGDTSAKDKDKAKDSPPKDKDAAPKDKDTTSKDKDSPAKDKDATPKDKDSAKDKDAAKDKPKDKGV